MAECTLCPRECGVDRSIKAGFCGCTDEIKVAKAMLHFGEEPCISGKRGSGAIFFSGCSLRCVFCQNYPISHELYGKAVTKEELKQMMLKLRDDGAHNINLVTATHYADIIAEILTEIKPELNIPVVYNCSGYEKVETLKKLERLIDIYLPDMKYYSPEMSSKYSSAPDYFRCALPALKEMIRQQPEAVIDEEGIMQCGVIVRHLILPKGYHDSMKLLDEINELEHRPLVSIMRQYTPCYGVENFPEINRKLTTFEYEKVTDHCADLGLEGFMQEKGCETLEMTPDW